MAIILYFRMQVTAPYFAPAWHTRGRARVRFGKLQPFVNRPASGRCMGGGGLAIGGVKAERAFPLLKEYRAAFQAAGAAQVFLSGAGPTLFAATRQEGAAKGWHSALAAAGYSPILTSTSRHG